jgi:uncharacterized protein (DUF2164 family)
MATKIKKQFLELINLSEVKSIEQEMIVDWVKNENGEYVYNGSETTTTIKTRK